MAKRFKLKISRVIPSFHSSRSKDPSTLPENHHPSFLQLSPVNPNAFDIDFPATTDPPPPSKSHISSLKCHVSSAILSVGCGFRSIDGRPSLSSDDNTESSEYKWKKEEKWHVIARAQDDTLPPKIHNSSFSSDSDDGDVSPPPPSAPPPTAAETKMKKTKNQRNKKKKFKQRARISTSSSDSGWFSSEGDEETETFVSSRSLSFDSYSDFIPHLETIRESPTLNRLNHKKKNLNRVKRVKRNASKLKAGGESTGKAKTCSSPETGSQPARLSVLQGLIPCKVDRKVRESFAVVKRSVDPYEDFKQSMLEMILEKHLFERRDLEQLLHCFLLLNSRRHHGIIVEAFSEIWEVLFCKSPRT